MSPSKVTFATVPWQLEPDGVGITWVPSKAQQLWNAINSDTKWPPAITNGSDVNPLTAAPDAITVNAVDGTSEAGAGASTAAVAKPRTAAESNCSS